MNLDFIGTFDFGDEGALRYFLFAHQLAHDQEVAAVSEQYGVSVGTYNTGGETVIDSWAAMMRNDIEGIPHDMADWLAGHNDSHVAILSYLSQAGSVQVDLSVVDFHDPTQFYDWMQAHLLMHDFEQQHLGITN